MLQTKIFLWSVKNPDSTGSISHREPVKTRNQAYRNGDGPQSILRRTGQTSCSILDSRFKAYPDILKAFPEYSCTGATPCRLLFYSMTVRQSFDCMHVNKLT